MSSRYMVRHFVGRLGFTLVELLVVIGIIAILVGVLMPALIGARAQSRTVLCASNIRQLCTALQNYATENHGLYPPNDLLNTDLLVTANWFDVDRIGRYVKGKITLVNDPPEYSQLGGPLFTCPEDDNSARSYAMNFWVSCVEDPSKIALAQGELWRGSGVRMTCNVILLTERWSTSGSVAKGFLAPQTIGSVGTKPGPRFGVGVGVSLPSPNSHWKPAPTCELPYMFHRRSGDGGGGTRSYGRVNIGYIDGHVATKSVADLADRTTGLSTMDSLWSPLDWQQNN